MSTMVANMWLKNIGLGIDMDELEVHDTFAKKMAEKFPRYFGEGKRYGGFAIGEGWYHIIESLVSEIDHYTKWRRNMRANDLRQHRAMMKGRDALLKFLVKGKAFASDWDQERADEIMENLGREITPKVEWIHVEQIKEKFGGLRFYYQGGDDQISGMVRMAELWAGRSCERCGDRGERRSGGWIRTLCDKHEAMYQVSKGNYDGN
jgi:hypothetical protein